MLHDWASRAWLQRPCRSPNNLPGSAVTALKAVVFNERALQGMKLSILRQTFNCGDLPTFKLHGQGEARKNALAIDKQSACAARTLVAALFGTVQFEVLAQEIEQRGASVELDFD